MKRDMDLARQIMLELEEAPYDGSLLKVDVADYDEGAINYHVMLLTEAGLIEAKDLSSFDGVEWAPTRLTWQGHEFLDEARNENRWNQAKKTIAEKGGSLTFDILKGVLAQLGRQAVGL